MDNSATLLWIRIDSQAKRRWTLLALYISYLAICLFSARARSSSGFLLWADVAAICIAGVIFAGSWAALVRLVREYVFPGDLRLLTSRDERQTSVRHGSFIRAYSMMTILIGSR